MSEPFLIAHSVRGEAAFDVATKMECPHCDHGTCYAETMEGAWEEWACFDCDSLGFWWIIPTSGHRAWPYWQIELGALMHDTEKSFHAIIPTRTLDEVPRIPPAWPDHFKSLPASKLDITSLFKATQPQKPRIARRL